MSQSLKMLLQILSDVKQRESLDSSTFVTCAYFPYVEPRDVNNTNIYIPVQFKIDNIEKLCKKICGERNEKDQLIINKTVHETFYRNIGKISTCNDTYYVKKISKLIKLDEGFAIITLYNTISPNMYPIINTYHSDITTTYIEIQCNTHDLVFKKMNDRWHFCINFNVDENIKQNLKDINDVLDYLSKKNFLRQHKHDS